MLGAEIQEQPGRRDFRPAERILRNRALLIFDLDGQVVALQHGFGDLHDRRQLDRFEPMIDVVGHPDLEKARRSRADGAAAINEVLLHPPHLGDVVVLRHERLVGQHPVHLRFGMRGEQCLEFLDRHGLPFRKFLRGTRAVRAPSARSDPARPETARGSCRADRESASLPDGPRPRAGTRRHTPS